MFGPIEMNNLNIGFVAGGTFVLFIIWVVTLILATKKMEKKYGKKEENSEEKEMEQTDLPTQS
jgi:hypothetical protein